MKCSKCHQENREGINYCEFCGEKLPDEPAQAGSKCETCGKINREGILFCEFCGAKLSSGKDSGEKSATAMKCSKCGKSIPPGIQVCQFCGTPRTTPQGKPANHKKIKPVYFLVAAGIVLVGLLVCIILGIIIGILPWNRSNNPAVFPAATESKSSPAQENAIMIPDFGDFSGLTFDEAQIIGNAMVEYYYPNLDLTDDPLVERSIDNGINFINVVYGNDYFTDSGIQLESVIVIKINLDDQTVIIVESD